jgi:hypothetical protein
MTVNDDTPCDLWHNVVGHYPQTPSSTLVHLRSDWLVTSLLYTKFFDTPSHCLEWVLFWTVHHTHTHTHTNTDLIKYAATPPNQPRYILITITLASSNYMVPDDGDSTKTCRSCFNENFNILLKQLYCSSVGKQNFDSINAWYNCVGVCVWGGGESFLNFCGLLYWHFEEPSLSGYL